MATTAKRPRAKSAARKSVHKAAARKPSPRKTTTKKAPKKRASPLPGKAKKSTKVKSMRSPVRKSATSARKPQTVKTRTAKPVRAKKVQRRLSPAAKKNLATKHLWALVEKKKRRDAQPPPWQNIGHHDHSATAPDSTKIDTTPPDADPAIFHVGSHVDRGRG